MPVGKILRLQMYLGFDSQTTYTKYIMFCWIFFLFEENIVIFSRLLISQSYTFSCINLFQIVQPYEYLPYGTVNRTMLVGREIVFVENRISIIWKPFYDSGEFGFHREYFKSFLILDMECLALGLG